ncbi:MAG: enoyl-CoA hydratase-related protein [Saccharolobus sp.]|uniref:enoyl-CoA hydratase/isomerase family protein n=1 Tax=Saccharolobus sp. TaxID=2100761 RepID=UPI003168880D
MKVLLEKRENACYITFNRPEKLNALDKESWGLLANYLESCEKDPEVFAIVLTGKGREHSLQAMIYMLCLS